MAYSFLNPDDIRYAINQLKLGTAWATIRSALAHVDATFINTQEVALTALAAAEKREVNPGLALDYAALSQKVTPTFTSITPASLDTAGGEEVVIVGTGFVDGCTVTIAGNPATILNTTPTELKVISPAHAAGAGLPVVITNPAPASLAVTSAAAATYAKPTLAFTSITPSSGRLAGGTLCKVVGTGFVKDFAITIDGVKPNVTSWSPTAIYLETPPHAAGAVNVVITNRNTDSVTGTGAYTYA
jgi:hypothetical protein